MIDLNSEIKGLAIAKKYYLFLNQATVSLTWTYASTG